MSLQNKSVSDQSVSVSTVVPTSFATLALGVSVGSAMLLSNKINKLEEAVKVLEEKDEQYAKRIEDVELRVANVIKTMSKDIDYAKQLNSINVEIAKLKFERETKMTDKDIYQQFKVEDEKDLFKIVDDGEDLEQQIEQMA
jgi:hypothetical protein